MSVTKEQLDTSRGSLTAIVPRRDDLVTIGNSHEPFRITEIVARDGFMGNRLVANGHFAGSKRARVHVPLHEINVVIPATVSESEAV